MSRVIKFRAWNKKGGHYYFPVELLWSQHGFREPNNQYPLKTYRTFYQAQATPAFWDEFDRGTFELEQFTGLIDKNGVEIYEGDICAFRSGNMLIKWSERGGFVAVNKDQKGDPGMAYYQWAMTFKHIRNEENIIIESINENEVIGNIHEGQP